MGLILLDTTVLVYATGTQHPLQQPCRSVIRAVGDGLLSAITTVEVIQEFAHVRSRRDGRDLARRQALAFADLLDPLEPTDRRVVVRGLDLFARHPELGAFDSVLAACALERNHIDGVMSADSGFDVIDGLRRFNPGRPDHLVELGITS